MREIDKIKSCSLLPKEGESKTRGHKFKARGEIFKRDPRGNFFSTEVGAYMEHAAELVEVGTIMTFRTHLDNYLERKDAIKWDYQG